MELLGLANQVVVGAMLDKPAISAKVESMGSVEALQGSLEVADGGG